MNRSVPPRRCAQRSSSRAVLLSLLLAGLLQFGAVTGAEPPIALHPDNPHYFLWRNRPTILITSGEHYGAVLNLDFDYGRYFEELQTCGLNHTRTFAGTYREIPSSFGITDNTLAPKPGRFISPWARSDQPGDFDGGPKFDLSRWDAAYFTRLRDFLQQAQQRGVVVELNLFCPMYNDELWQACPMNAANNVNGVGRCPREEVYALKHPELTDVQLAVTRKIVEEVRDFDNLYFEVCNEPYFGGVTIPWQHRIVEAIAETEQKLGPRHLISMNIANGRARVEQPHPAVSILNFHYCTPPDAVDLNYDLNRVIGENETGFRGREDAIYRTEGWMFLLAGGGLYNNLDYSFTPAHPDGSLLEYQSPGGGSTTLRRQLKILRDFLESFDFVHLRPAPDLVRKTTPGLSCRALAQPERAYALYLHVPLENKPKNLADLAQRSQRAQVTIGLPAGGYSIEWINPLTGAVDKRETCRHAGGDRTIESPEFVLDVAARIKHLPGKDQ